MFRNDRNARAGSGRASLYDDITSKIIAELEAGRFFVGVEAYEAAGGIVLRDLFQSDDGGWLQDPALLDSLVAEKLKAAADEIAGEGWKWVEAALSFPYGHEHGLRQLVGTTVDLTEEECATCEALRDEYDRLEAEYAEADELPDEIDARLGEIEQALDAFEQRPAIYDPADMAIAGVFVSLDADGSLSVDRGYVRPEDEQPVDPERDDTTETDGGPDQSATPAVQRAVVTVGGQAVEPEDDEEDGVKPLPERLVIELTAHRTLALRNAVAEHPDVAMAEERRLFYVALTRARRQVRIYTLFDSPSRFLIELARTGAVEIETEEGVLSPCPKCGCGTMRRYDGQYGPFEACSTHPRCDFKRNLSVESPRVAAPSNRVRIAHPMSAGDSCPTCGDGLMVVRSGGAYQPFLACSGYPSCKTTAALDGGTEGGATRARTLPG